VIEWCNNVSVGGDGGSNATMMNNSLTCEGRQAMEARQDYEDIPAAAAAYAYFVLE